jgi:multidrug efflux pump
VALTLSPMMCSKFLRAGDDEKGFAGTVTHTFERVRKFYSRVLDVTLNNRGYVYVVWIVISILGIVMVLMSQTELAPAEDQGFIFGFGVTSANATLDQNLIYSNAVEKVFAADPDTSFIFQITQPD